MKEREREGGRRVVCVCVLEEDKSTNQKKAFMNLEEDEGKREGRREACSA